MISRQAKKQRPSAAAEGLSVSCGAEFGGEALSAAGRRIRVAKESAVPDQPDDPIHYDMKIPPETHHSKDEKESSEPPADDSERTSDTAKDTNVVRGDDRPQAVRGER